MCFEVTIMFASAAITTSLLIFVTLKSDGCVAETPCPDGRTCPNGWQCCELGCCKTSSVPTLREIDDTVRESLVYPWYAQWHVLFILGCLGGIIICCAWCCYIKRPIRQSVYMCSFTCCVRRRPSNPDSAGSVYPPPRYSRCSSFHQAPPPYSEVTSKPDLYPLVITCGDGEGKAGGSYLMVHYFRNYAIRPPGSMSATSTAESLNSSFICNAANEANTVIPPPYSCASNYEECVGAGCGRSLLRSLSSLTDREPRGPPPMRLCDGIPVPGRTGRSFFSDHILLSPVDASYDLDFDLHFEIGTSPTEEHRPPSDIVDEYPPAPFIMSHLLNIPSPDETCESPPQPTSPTQTSRESTLRRSSDERRCRVYRRSETSRKSSKARKSSLYMPLSTAYPVRPSRMSPGMRTSSRSAPVTPCGSLVPNLLSFSQRASRHSIRSSSVREESNPLLTDIETTHNDHKF